MIMTEIQNPPAVQEIREEDCEMVSEAPELRAVRITLDPDRHVPWHWHSAVDDHFICLQGIVEIETRAPRQSYRLKPGEECRVTKKIAHAVFNPTAETACFMVIQGVGSYDCHPVGGTSDQ
jgi:quercetin dioxygenase-like cupin family protein